MKIGFKKLVQLVNDFVNEKSFPYELKANYAKQEIEIISNNTNKFDLKDLQKFVFLCDKHELNLIVLTPNTVLVWRNK